MKAEQDRTVNLIKRLQRGDEESRETLIGDYRGFIINAARNFTRESRDITQTDAYSIALIAFNEAAEKFDPERGNFPAFAGQVMKRRLIDMARSESKYRPEIAAGELPEIPADTGDEDEETEDLATDISWLENALAEFNISLQDLVKQTPKHRDTRCNALAMARYITNDPSLLAGLHKRKTLPFKSLLFHFRCNPKTIQRHRKYIIAACIALGGSSSYLRDYVTRVAKGCGENDA